MIQLIILEAKGVADSTDAAGNRINPVMRGNTEETV